MNNQSAQAISAVRLTEVDATHGEFRAIGFPTIECADPAPARQGLHSGGWQSMPLSAV